MPGIRSKKTDRFALCIFIYSGIRQLVYLLGLKSAVVKNATKTLWAFNQFNVEQKYFYLIFYRSASIGKKMHRNW